MFLRSILILLMVGSTLEAQEINEAPESNMERPNVVVIMADDLGYETLGVNGSASYKTPCLDQLARGGVRFEHCYSQPLCTPTRVKLMTGQSNIRNYVTFGVLDRSQKTFGNFFRDAGYATCIVGKWQLGPALDGPKHFGFDEHCLWQLDVRKERFPNPMITTNGKQTQYESGEYGPDVVADYAIDFIRRNKAKPFLVYYPMILTHCPFCPTPDSADWDPKNPGSKTYKGDAKYFGDMVSYMDKIIGRLVKCLEDSGVRENTLILFVGDNGTDKPVVSKMSDGSKVAGRKGLMKDGGTRVPLIASWPAQNQFDGSTPKVSQALVDMSDFLPTICEAAGIKVPEKTVLDGHSFMPQIKGEPGSSRESVYVWYSRNAEKGKNFKPKIFARNQRFKLYSTGPFFDVSNDSLEKNPLDKGALDEETKKIHRQLRAKIDSFQGKRLSSIPKSK